MANLAVTVALLPALFTEGAGTGPIRVQAGDTLDTVPVVAASSSPYGEVLDLTPAEAGEVPATSTTAPPSTAPPSTAPPTTVPPTTTTTVVRPAAPTAAPKAPAATTTTAPAPAPPPTGTETGSASWYDHEPGVCAHKSLPFGTVVTVTHTGNGKATTCTVGDRGPYVEGWIIDLHPEQFEDLAPRSTGVIPVRISW